MKIIEDNNHYHDTGTNTNNLINEQTTNERSIKGNAEPVGPAADEEDYSNEIRQITNNYNELIKDRRSFYDNQWTAVTSSDDVKLYKSEKSIDINADDVNKSSSKHERDDFDDLVDMTHRVPRKLLKKETATTVQNSNENVYYPMNGYSSRKHANKSSSSSLPPLPPLPYSFVKLEKSKLSASNSSTSLNSNSSKSTYVKSSSDTTRGKQSTTRLIIPINKDYQLTTPFSANEPKTTAVLTENTNRIPQEEINIEIFEPTIKNNNKNTLNHPIKCSSVNYNDNRSCNNNVTNRKNCSHANGNNNSNSNSSSSSVSQSNANVRLIFTDGGAGGGGGSGGGSQLMTNLDKNSATSFSNSSEEDICDESEIISNANSNTSATNSTNNTNTTNMNINNNANHQHQHYVALNGSNLNAKKDNNNHLIVKSKPKSSDIINSEWDQISKIFASLETLLNEVVDQTSKTTTSTESSAIESQSNGDKSTIISSLSSASSSQTASICEKYDKRDNFSFSNTSECFTPLNKLSQTNLNEHNICYDTHACPNSNSNSNTNTITLNNKKSSSKPSATIEFAEPKSNFSTLNQHTSSHFNTHNNIHVGNGNHCVPMTGEKENFDTNNLDFGSCVAAKRNFKHVEVGEFLKKINLPRYEHKLLSNGYDDIYFLNDVVTLQDLLQMGIEDYNDIFHILSEIKKLPSSIKKIYEERIKFPSVNKWLNYLNLNEYLDKFLLNNINTIERAKKLWEIELMTILQIPYLGHRRRIMSSLEIFIKMDKEANLANQVEATMPIGYVDLNNYQKSRTEPQLEVENHATADMLLYPSSSSSPSLAKKLLNLNSLMTANGVKSDELNNLKESMSVRKNCLSCRSTFSSNSSSAAAPSSTNSSNLTSHNLKSVKFTDDSKKASAGELTMGAFVHGNSSAASVYSSNYDTEDGANSLTNNNNHESNYILDMLLKHQKKKKFDYFHLSKMKKRSPQSTDSSTSSEHSNHKLAGHNHTKMSSIRCDDDAVCGGTAIAYTSSNDDCRFPKPIWKNDPQNLIKGSYNFVVYYLGSSAIPKMKTNHDPVKATIDRLKNTSKSTPYQSPKVELSVSINGVKLLHNKTKEELCNYDIKHINNVCQDQDDLNYFAFSTQTDPSAHYYCHVFSCRDKELSTQIILTIGQAFDIAYELFCKNNFN